MLLCEKLHINIFKITPIVLFEPKNENKNFYDIQHEGFEKPPV